MVKLLHILLNIFSFASLIYILYIIIEVFKLIIKKYIKKEKYKFKFFIFNTNFKKIIFSIIIILGIFNFVLDTWYSQPTIGSFYEKNEYVTKYYIYLYDDSNYINCKKLPAEIECVLNVDEKDLNYDIIYNYYRTYYINKIFLPSMNSKFPNDYTINNCINFENQEININKKNSIIDKDGNTYYIELTNEKCLIDITEEKTLEKIDKIFQSTPYYQNSEENKQ